VKPSDLRYPSLGKRHHTRFYPTEAANAANDGNPKAGTVVDRGRFSCKVVQPYAEPASKV
jgi:hypothetical protein